MIDLLWSDFEAGEGGDIVSLISRELCADIPGALKIVDSDFPPDYVPPPMASKSKRENTPYRYAYELWKAADRNDATVAAHPYAQRKEVTWAAGAGRVKASGKLNGKDSDCLVLPMRTWANELVGVEVINAEGWKQTFGNEGILQLGNTINKTIPLYITEGWADAVATYLNIDDFIRS